MVCFRGMFSLSSGERMFLLKLFPLVFVQIDAQIILLKADVHLTVKGKRLHGQVRFFGKFELEILFILQSLGYAMELC